MSDSSIVVICGPTATGKTDLGIALAQGLGGEIVNADSRQVYRFMDVGTAKPTAAQRASTPHHLLDVVDPGEPFTLAEYLERAREAVAAVQSRGRLPIVVGGTGLYVRALVQGFDVPRVPPNPCLRAELEALAAGEGLSALLSRLRRIDPRAALTVDARNPRRLIRAIEVAEATTSGPAYPGTAVPAPCHPGSPLGRAVAGGVATANPYDALVLGLTAERAVLHARADRRVDAMMAAGFLCEVESLLARGYDPELPALSSLGYGELIDHLRGRRSLDAAVQATRFATHRFIRRQLTWFRREPGLRWLDVTRDDARQQAMALARQWLGAVASRERAGQSV